MAPRNTFAATRRSHTILRWLKNGRSVRISDVSDEFNIEYAQARADLKLLEDEYGLETDRDGRIKVWKWEDFDPECADVATAASLELGAIAIDLFRETPYGQAIDNLVDYCRNRLPDTQQDDVARLSDSLHLRRTWLPAQRDDIYTCIECVLDALNKHWLVGRYQAADGELGDYVIFPRKLIWYQGRLWLLGRHEDELKLFDLAGFQELSVDFGTQDSPIECLRSFLKDHGAIESVDDDVTLESDDAIDAAVERRWSPDSPSAVTDGDASLDADPSSYFEDAYGIYAQNYPTEEIHLEVSGSWRSYFERYRMHPSQEITEADDGESLHVEFRMHVCPEFKSFVMGMAPDVTVHGPDELRQELRERVQDWIGEAETDQPGA
jgi:hypothetical protein